ncbi:MAG: hypothetical protein NTX55_01230 [Candidatus Parcubacteria bacterium]|nr:hypothetical protein [Candidatus Parcubacteria bacterium]
MQLERWLKFSKSQQVGAIASELARAKEWQEKDKDKFLLAIERVLELIDSTLDDSRWRNWLFMLYGLRQEISMFYCGDIKKDIDILYNAL